jgi:hypothetical protein
MHEPAFPLIPFLDEMEGFKPSLYLSLSIFSEYAVYTTRVDKYLSLLTDEQTVDDDHCV